MRKIKTIAKKRTRRVRNSLNRAEILSAALKIIQTDGVESLSMRSIAKHLNCSVASPYAHFKNQEEIIQALLYSGEQKLTADLNIARASTENPDGLKKESSEMPRPRYNSIARTMWAWMYGLLVLQMTEILNREKLKQDPIEEGMLVFKTLFRNAIDEEKSKKKK